MSKVRLKLAYMAILAGSLAASQASAESLDVMIATIEAGRVVTANSPHATRTREAIKKLMAACPKEKNEFPSRVFEVTKKELTSRGRLTNATEVFEGIQAIVIDYPAEDCTNIFAFYLTTRNTTGFNHSEAVASLRYLVVTAHAIAKK